MIFIDTSAWVAIADRNDQYAEESAQRYTQLILNKERLATSDFILVETYNLLSKTIGAMPTIRFGNILASLPTLTIEHVARVDWDRGWKILEKYDDKKFSFTDCTSFAMMERLKIKTAFSFDAHFTQFGFGKIP
ncbi:MAG: PIN domain-containing protein [Deltaproteobacteria bacterium]|nr:PIN domain-containing protein [Deltaproteobacteria bacterium]